MMFSQIGMSSKHIQLKISKPSDCKDFIIIRCIQLKGNYYHGTYSFIEYLKENVLPGRKSISYQISRNAVGKQ